MRLVFFGTGEIALPAFAHLIANGPKPLALVTQPDKPVGRHQTPTPPAIKVMALEAGIPVFQPEKSSDAAADLTDLRPELIVVMAYGQILRKSILTLPSKAIINLHASLLPKFRGAACIQAAIDAGDAETGITAMHVVRELDAGDIILARKIPISPDETGGSLHDKLAALAPEVLAEVLERIADGSAKRIPQRTEDATHVSKLERDDGRLDWTMSAEALERRIRAYDPWPGTFTTTLADGRSKRLKVFPPTRVLDQSLTAGGIDIANGRLVIGCGEGALELTTVQSEGSRKMSATDYLLGHKPGLIA